MWVLYFDPHLISGFKIDSFPLPVVLAGWMAMGEFPGRLDTGYSYSVWRQPAYLVVSVFYHSPGDVPRGHIVMISSREPPKK